MWTEAPAQAATATPLIVRSPRQSSTLQLSQQHAKGCKLHEAEESDGVILPAHQEPTLPTLPAHFVSSSALVTLLIGATIAAIAPFDLAFATLTHGSALARVCLLVTLGLIGIHCSNLNGFVLHKRGAHPIIVGALCALGVAVYVALIDAWLFRAVLPRSYVDFFHTHDLRQRLIY
jgi:hypothetical protein